MTKAQLPSYVGVLIPAYDESGTIGEVVREARNVSATVLVVDDGSSDGSASIAEGAGARVLRRTGNEGQGKALTDGIVVLRDLGFTHVVTLDGDAAHDASSSVELWAAHVESNADLTIGSRFLNEQMSLAIPSHKVAANRLGAELVSLLLGTRFTDVACGMRVMGPRALALPLRSTGFGFAFELLWCAVREGLELHEHPIPVRYDAREPFWTKQAEVIDFLQLCLAMSKGNPLTMDLISRIKAGVDRFESLAIRLRGDVYYLHGLPSYRAYMVQLQHPWFLSPADGDLFSIVNFDELRSN